MDGVHYLSCFICHVWCTLFVMIYMSCMVYTQFNIGVLSNKIFEFEFENTCYNARKSYF